MKISPAHKEMFADARTVAKEKSLREQGEALAAVLQPTLEKALGAAALSVNPPASGRAVSASVSSVSPGPPETPAPPTATMTTAHLRWFQAEFDHKTVFKATKVDDLEREVVAAIASRAGARSTKDFPTRYGAGQSIPKSGKDKARAVVKILLGQ